MSVKVFDISIYGSSSVEQFIGQYEGKKVKCQAHNDKKPSAHVYKDHIHCFSCGTHFFFENWDSQYKINSYNASLEKTAVYHNNLTASSNQSMIRKFLKERNLTDKENKTIQDFQLGFDEARNALVFPIKNINGYINGFGFRQIDATREPKYWNSNGKDGDENSPFIKSNNLYGIDKITEKCKHLVICEGYIDVISAYKNGFRDEVCFVALMGIALGENHIPLIKYLKRIYNIDRVSLMLDNDESGKKATLNTLRILLKGGIIPNIICYNEIREKDVDEILKRVNGRDILQTLIGEQCYDFLDYLLKLKTEDKELKTYIDYLEDEDAKGMYAAKICRAKKLYNNLKHKESRYDNILSLTKEEIKKYFIKEENYFNNNLPKYFTFQKVLYWAELEVIKLNKSGFLFQDFKKLENVNYKLLGNKNGEYAWRQYQIINPILYIKLVDVIYNNWQYIQQCFDNKSKHIKCTSLSVVDNKNDNFAHNTARQIINWWDGMEQESVKESLKYKYVIHTDIVDCYGSIYTHSIPWALHGKQIAKQQKDNKDLLGNQIDLLLQCMSHGQTNGIPQGSVLMDFIAEILLHYIDNELERKIKEDENSTNIKIDFCILRYRDDYRIFANEVGVAKKVLKFLSEVLVETGGMRLSSEKTQVLDCIVSGSIKKDKLHYFECFKEHSTIRNDILNIYLFAKKFPNSGSILRLLKSFNHKITDKINQISLQILEGTYNEKMDDFDLQYIISILSEIMYSHPRTYPLLCDIMYNIISIMKSEERKIIAQNIACKMKDVPNGELLRIWLERMTYIDNDDIGGWKEFFTHCSKDYNKTLLYKQYNNETIWEFDKAISKDSMPSILNSKIFDSLKRAETGINQEHDVNEDIFGPFTADEVDIFYRYGDI